MDNRTLKNSLYEQVARIGKAVSSPKRLELVELLAQGEKSVETLSSELSSDIKLTSAHLRALKEARLVTSRREGKYIIYRLAGNDVASLWVSLRQVAEEHLLELKMALGQMASDPTKLVAVSRQILLEQARRGDIVVIDVRPRTEYEAAHLPFARSMPVAEIEQRLAELPTDREIVAVASLAARGYRARKIPDGVNEWQAAGFPVESPGVSP